MPLNKSNVSIHIHAHTHTHTQTAPSYSKVKDLSITSFNSFNLSLSLTCLSWVEGSKVAHVDLHDILNLSILNCFTLRAVWTQALQIILFFFASVLSCGIYWTFSSSICILCCLDYAKHWGYFREIKFSIRNLCNSVIIFKPKKKYERLKK